MAEPRVLERTAWSRIIMRADGKVEIWERPYNSGWWSCVIVDRVILEADHG